jgi:hypothetical protein
VRRGLLPPCLHNGERPHLSLDGKRAVERGDSIALRGRDARRIGSVRLMRPGSATHTTDFDQRSVALTVEERDDDSLTVRVPDDVSLVPPGWYMVFAVDARGDPSKAAWVQVG